MISIRRDSVTNQAPPPTGSILMMSEKRVNVVVKVQDRDLGFWCIWEMTGEELKDE